MGDADVLGLLPLFGFMEIGDRCGACYDYSRRDALEGRGIRNLGAADWGEGHRGVGVEGG